MRQSILLAVCVSVSAYLFSACESEHQNNTYELACKASGGVFKDNTCTCTGNPCGEGVICDDVGRCAFNTENALKQACQTNEAVEDKSLCDRITTEIQLSCLTDANIANKESCNQVTTGIQLSCLSNPDIEDKSKCSQVSSGLLLSCLTSGGVIANENCQCGPTVCSSGIVCAKDKNDTLKCASEMFNCSTGQYRCFNDEESQTGIFQSCEDMQWVDKTTCNKVSCTNTSIFESEQQFKDQGGECGECINDTVTACEMGEDNIGTYKTCSNGKLSESKACENNFSCALNEDAESVCGECLNGEIQCTGDTKYRICDFGHWTDDRDCPGRAKCDDTQCLDEDLEDCTESSTVIENFKCENSQIQECVSGKYTLPVACVNSDGCKDEHSCETCVESEIQCTDETHYRQCNQGNWTETTVCPGNAKCENNQCQTEGLVECTEAQEGETKCENGQIQTCYNGKYSALEACPNSDGCLDEHTCGECRTGEVVCENIDTGSRLRACTQEYKWHESYYSNSCKSDTEVGECSNGHYKYDDDYVSQSTYGAVIQRCANGQWPFGEVTDDIFRIPGGPCNSKNDSIYTNILNISSKRATISTNYLDFLHIYSKNTAFDYNALKNTYQLSKIKDEEGNSCDDYFWGFSGGCHSLYDFIHTSYGKNTEVLNKWFSCTASSCDHVSLCVDAITTGQLDENIKPSPHILTFDNKDNELSLIIDVSPDACNSNRTGAKGECTGYTIDMTNQYQNIGAFEDQDMNFDICRYGSQRNVICNKTQNAEGIFSCRFNEVKDKTKGFDSETLCLDFYDKNYNHSAYTFVGVNKYNMTDILKEGTDKSKYMVKCKSTLCNTNWTDCLCFDKDGKTCACNDDRTECK